MRVLLAGLALFAATAAAQVQSDWERKYEEQLKQADEQAILPPPLDRARLVAVQLEVPSSFRYFVDAGSVSVGQDRIVRFVVVAQSPSGVENVSFEGLRCPGDYRVYAVALPDGSWGGRPSAWRPLPQDPRAVQRVLSRRYFCPARAAIRSAEEGAKALRDGGHAVLLAPPP